eukprot:4359654-Prymnesium_polylepis.2
MLVSGIVEGMPDGTWPPAAVCAAMRVHSRMLPSSSESSAEPWAGRTGRSTTAAAALSDTNGVAAVGLARLGLASGVICARADPATRPAPRSCFGRAGAGATSRAATRDRSSSRAAHASASAALAARSSSAASAWPCAWPRAWPRAWPSAWPCVYPPALPSSTHAWRHSASRCCSSHSRFTLACCCRSAST